MAIPEIGFFPGISPITIVSGRVDTPAAAVIRRARHAKLCGHYQRLAALFYALAVEIRDGGDANDFPGDDVIFYMERAARAARMARSELFRCF